MLHFKNRGKSGNVTSYKVHKILLDNDIIYNIYYVAIKV